MVISAGSKIGGLGQTLRPDRAGAPGAGSGASAKSDPACRSAWLINQTRFGFSFVSMITLPPTGLGMGWEKSGGLTTWMLNSRYPPTTVGDEYSSLRQLLRSKLNAFVRTKPPLSKTGGLNKTS